MAAMLLPSALPCPNSPRAPTPSRPTPRENIIRTCQSLQQILSLSPSRASLPRTPSKSRFPRASSRPQTPRTPMRDLHTPPALNLRRSIAKAPRTPLRTPVKTPPPRGLNKRRRETDDVGGKPTSVFGGNIFEREFRFTQENPTRNMEDAPALEENPFVTPKRVRVAPPELPAMPVRNLRARRIVRRRPLFVPRRRVQEEWEWERQTRGDGELVEFAELVTRRLNIGEAR